MTKLRSKWPALVYWVRNGPHLSLVRSDWRAWPRSRRRYCRSSSRETRTGIRPSKRKLVSELVSVASRSINGTMTNTRNSCSSSREINDSGPHTCGMRAALSISAQPWGVIAPKSQSLKKLLPYKLHSQRASWPLSRISYHKEWQSNCYLFFSRFMSAF